MQNEWPHVHDDSDDRAVEETALEAPHRSTDRPSRGEVDHRAGSTRSPAEPAVAGDEATATIASPTDPGAAEEGEDHRSAVDAIDELLDEVELSLARLDDGSYGRCDSCGAAIEDDRLAQSPVIRTCGSCVEVSPALVAAGGGAAEPTGTTEDRPD